MKNDLPGYELLARAFYSEGVRANFTLMGDANMHWTVALSEFEGLRTIHARHEHCACGMAIGYAYATGKVGVASVTLGPGFTQTMTALATAAQAVADRKSIPQRVTVVGSVAPIRLAPEEAMLVRPDGVVAWRGRSADALAQAYDQVLARA